MEPTLQVWKGRPGHCLLATVGTGDPRSTQPQTLGSGHCLVWAGRLTVRGAASFRRREHLVGVWGTVRIQPPFPLFFFFLMVHSAAA